MKQDVTKQIRSLEKLAVATMFMCSRLTAMAREAGLKMSRPVVKVKRAQVKKPRVVGKRKVAKPRHTEPFEPREEG